MKPIPEACSTPERDRSNQKRILAWTAVWGLSFLGVVYAVKVGWLGAGWPAALGAIVPTLAALATTRAYRRFLREADELRRRIEIDALAFAFSVGVVGGLAYWLLERAGLVEADVAILVSVMLMSYAVGTLIGHRRYA